MPKLIKLNRDARMALMRGIDTLANIVKSTLGPKGRNVIIDRPFLTPIVSNDGVTIAKEVELPDPFENMGAVLLKEVAQQTNDIAGDGTTTATVLAQALVKEGLNKVEEGANPVMLNKGLHQAVKIVEKRLMEMTRPVGRDSQLLEKIAVIASNDEEIGRIISTALRRIGASGFIELETSNSSETTMDLIEGMEFERGYLSHSMATDQRTMEAVLEHPCILVSTEKLTSPQQIEPLLQIVTARERPLLIIAEEVSGEVIGTLTRFRMQQGLPVVAIKTPEYGFVRDLVLEDIAIFTGGELITEKMGRNLKEIAPEDLGGARRVIVNKDTTRIIEGSGNPEYIQGRKEEIAAQIEKTTQEWEKEKQKERLARMAGGMARIKVGGDTVLERREKLLRTEDALNAARSAIERGVIPGGGAAFCHAAKAVEERIKTRSHDENLGAEIVFHALFIPLYTIAENSGFSGDEVVAQIRQRPEDYGFDVLTGNPVNMFEQGIIDPLEVARSAIIHAASIASLILTTESLITDDPSEGMGDPTAGPARGGGAEKFE